jgi:hypothetical protein|tara:strand:+ start:106 stop:411 length:306 start_codon:yes stop_codon:yes gene_type:complete
MNKEEENKLEFFIKVREKFEDIEDLAEDYGLKKDFMSVMCVGLIEEDISPLRYKVNAISSIFVDNESELASLMSHIAGSYDKGDDDFSNIDYWLNREGGDA